MGKNTIDIATMGGRIKALRHRKGWSQEELGFRIGVNSKSVVSEYEHDRRSVSLPVLTVLAQELETTIDYLVYGSGKEDMDPDVEVAIHELKNLKTQKGKKAALEHIIIVEMME